MEGVVATQARVRAGGWCSGGGGPSPIHPLSAPAAQLSHLSPPSSKCPNSGRNEFLWLNPGALLPPEEGRSGWRREQISLAPGDAGAWAGPLGLWGKKSSVWPRNPSGQCVGSSNDGSHRPAFPVQVGVLAPPASSAGARIPLVSAHGPRESSRVLTAVDDRRWLLVKPLSTTVFYKAFYKLLLYFLTFR